MSPQRAARQKKFQAIGKAISSMQFGNEYDGRDYNTGVMARFEFKRYDAHQRDGLMSTKEGFEFCRWPKDRVEVPLGPSFRTPQWERTVRS